MTIAEKIKNKRIIEFKNEFDLETFDKFIEEEITKKHYVEIGIRDERPFDSSYFKNQPQYNGWKSESKWLTFAEGYEAYIWTTNCQIPQKFAQLVASHLRSQGLKVCFGGACGYATYDIIEVTI